MELKRGAVVTASIADPSGMPRPFPVIRSGWFSGHTLVTLLAFTTTMTDTPLLRVTAEPTARNGLQFRSQAMVDHIQSVRVKRIGRIIGHLDGADMLAIANMVAAHLGFGDTFGTAAPTRT